MLFALDNGVVKNTGGSDCRTVQITLTPRRHKSTFPNLEVYISQSEATFRSIREES